MNVSAKLPKVMFFTTTIFVSVILQQPDALQCRPEEAVVSGCIITPSR